MTIDQLVKQALELNNKDKAILAETLWESLEHSNLSYFDLTEEDAIALAEKRAGDIESGGVKPILHQDLIKRLRY